ncbi:MAG: TIGR02449 family protein [Gammaproteobacteria bacterium]|nr:TIGR02449 family protein [Gammaproteobacteria bacterium]
MPDDLSALESRVDELIDRCEALARENRILRENNRSWTVERAGLVERNEAAKSKVEAMIERLKSLDGE